MKRTTLFLFIFSSLLTLIFGIFLTNSLRQQAEIREKKYLLNSAEILSSSINKEELSDLTGSPEDTEKKGYQTIKATLRRVQETSLDARFIYLMGEGDNEKLLFYVDSEPVESLDYSAPGDIYEETSPELYANYQLAKSYIEGPSTDRWGTWVSAFAPVYRDESSGEQVAILGIDLDARIYNQRIFESMIFPLAGTVIAQILIWGYFVYFRKRNSLITEVINEKNTLTSILSNLPVGVLLTDVNTQNIVSLNPCGEELLGRVAKKNESLESFRTDIKLTKEDGSPYPQEETPSAMALTTGKKIKKSDLFIQKKSGTIALQSFGVPILDNTDKFNLLLSIFEDRTKEFEIDKAKTEFVSLASHQLRTPLTAINWHVELLLDEVLGKLSPEQRESLKEVETGSKRMVDLVNSLLNVSRIELGTFSINPEILNIPLLLKSVIEEQMFTIRQKSINFTLKLEEDLPEFLADKELLRMVFENLLSNAVKYTPEKGSVSVKVYNEYQSIIFEIIDTGYGIPAPQQDQIFTKLFRADNVREKDTEGTGLGLYIVKAIVEQSKGDITFISKENEGTTFTVKLPLSGMQKKEGPKSLS